MENFHVLKVKYLGATNFKGSRVKIKSERFNESVTIPFDYNYTRSYELAYDYLVSKGYKIVGMAEMSGYDLLISQTFKGLKNE